jgi:hypothetical protein
MRRHHDARRCRATLPLLLVASLGACATLPRVERDPAATQDGPAGVATGSAAGTLDMGEAPPRLPRSDMPSPPPLMETAGKATGLDIPESARHDAAAGRWYVSNTAGPFLEKNGRGFISIVDDSGRVTERQWIANGRNGVTLHAPTGLALAGDTLWVADVDVLRAFDRTSGRPLTSVDLAPLGAVFLNAIAVGEDGAVYVTDTDMRGDARGVLQAVGHGRVYRVARGEAPRVALSHARLSNPNGIAWQGSERRFIIVPFGGDTIVTWRPGDAEPQPLVVGPGLFDGVEVTRDGRILVSSQATDAVHMVQGDQLPQVLTDLPGVADIGLSADGRLAVPQLAPGTVTLFRLPPLPAARRSP